MWCNYSALLQHLQAHSLTQDPPAGLTLMPHPKRSPWEYVQNSGGFRPILIPLAGGRSEELVGCDRNRAVSFVVNHTPWTCQAFVPVIASGGWNNAAASPLPSFSPDSHRAAGSKRVMDFLLTELRGLIKGNPRRKRLISPSPSRFRLREKVQ